MLPVLKVSEASKETLLGELASLKLIEAPEDIALNVNDDSKSKVLPIKVILPEVDVIAPGVPVVVSDSATRS